MRIPDVIRERPEDALNKIIAKQQTVRTSKLKSIVENLLKKIAWQEKTLRSNLYSIQKLNDRAQKAETKIARKKDELGRASETIRTLERKAQKAESWLVWKERAYERVSTKLHTRAQLAETQLGYAKREIAALKLQKRITQRQTQYVKDGLENLRKEQKKGTCELCDAKNVLVKASESHMALVCMGCTKQ